MMVQSQHFDFVVEELQAEQASFLMASILEFVERAGLRMGGGYHQENSITGCPADSGLMERIQEMDKKIVHLAWEIQERGKTIADLRGALNRCLDAMEDARDALNHAGVDRVDALDAMYYAVLHVPAELLASRMLGREKEEWEKQEEAGEDDKQE